MKKALLTLLTFLISFSLLAACSQKEKSPVTGPGKETPVLSPAPSSAMTPDLPSSAPAPTPDAIETAPADSSLITKEVFSALSAPKLKGRVMGSTGSKKARSIIQDLFADLHLKPFDEDYLSPVFRDPFRETSAETAKKGDGYNIVGLLEGKKEKECLIISAHYDGKEGGPSALDNASGVYGLLRIAEKMSEWSTSNTPARDILFAAFDGEEAGLIGSSYMADQIQKSYEKIIVINLDCIGIKKTDSYMVSGNSAQFAPLIDSLYKQLELYDFATVPAIDTYGSDHLPFEWYCLPAVTIGERDVEGIVHTPEDTAGIVNTAEIEHLAEAVYFYILEQSDKMFGAFWN